MTDKVLRLVQEQLAAGKKVAMITVTKTRGSSPASVGQLMAVTAEGITEGTIGGGRTEHLVITRAVEALEGDENVFEFSYNHAESGMVCGGEMEGFGSVLGQENQLYIFGGGHISQSLAPMAVMAGFAVTIIEDRPEYAEYFENVNYLVATADQLEEKLILKGSPYVVICTRGHKSDDEALRFAIKKPTEYIGMIGSKKKVTAIFEKMKKEGFTSQELEQIYAPIGLDIASSIPVEIGVSILAEMLMVKNSGSPAHKKL